MYSQGVPHKILGGSAPTAPTSSLPKVIWEAVGIAAAAGGDTPLALKNRYGVASLALTGYAALISLSIFSIPSLALSTASTLLLPKLKIRTLMSKRLPRDMRTTLMIMIVTIISDRLKP